MVSAKKGPEQDWERRRTEVLSVRLSPEELARLDAVTELFGENRTTVLRLLLRWGLARVEQTRSAPKS